MTFTERLNCYEKLMRLDRPIGVLLLLWPTLWGLWFAAGGLPPWKVLLIFVVGTILMRSAGCVINDYADRDFDLYVERTKNRPLATRKVSTKEALILAAILSLTAFLLILPLDKLVWWLSIPALFIAASNPYTKRFFAIPQAYLGVAFGFGIPMGFAAVHGSVPALAWVLLVANLFWTIAYDTEYAMVDRADDLKINIKTSAITFGNFDVLAVLACYGIFLIILAAIGVWQKMGIPYYLGLFSAFGLTVYHYSLIRARQPKHCFKAFLHNNWVGAVIFAGIGLDFATRHVL
jgi:4-hydroxybenzoate polyprenyltransferase